MNPVRLRSRNDNAFAGPASISLASLPALACALALFGFTNPLAAQFYQKSILDSDIAGMGANTDANLIGAWGVAHLPTSPWWVNTSMGGTSVLFSGSGAVLPLVVTIPVPAGSTASHSMPTGIVDNTGSLFDLGPAGVDGPALYLFVTRDGTIAGWNGSLSPKTSAVTMVDNSASGADYTGVAIAPQNGADMLYAANFGQNRVDVFTGQFAPATLAPGAFMDPRIPSDERVFNVQWVDGMLYVTYAPDTAFSPTMAPKPGQGYVDVYNVNGSLVRRLRHGWWMSAPWGVTMAPADFGHFSNDILVGMFGNGRIAAFDPMTGQFRGIMRTWHGKPLAIMRGLWGLEFGNGASAGPTNTLYFASDDVIQGVFHGLFGTITVMPPSMNGEKKGHDDGHGSED